MGGACNTYGGGERYVQGFGGGNLKERDHFEDTGVDGRMDLREVGCRSMDWIDLA